MERADEVKAGVVRLLKQVFDIAKADALKNGGDPKHLAYDRLHFFLVAQLNKIPDYEIKYLCTRNGILASLKETDNL